MIKLNNYFVAITFITSIPTQVLAYVPVTAPFAISIDQTESQGDFILRENAKTTVSTSLANTFPSSLGNLIVGYGDLSTGKMGGKLVNHGPIIGEKEASIGGTVSIFDTLKFDTPSSLPANISYSFKFDGLISNKSDEDDSGAILQAHAFVYDITGRESDWILDAGSFYMPTPGYGAISAVTINFVLGSDNFYSYYTGVDEYGYPILHYDRAVLDNTGVSYEFDMTKDGSFLAYPDRTYGIYLSTGGSARAEGFGSTVTADFLHTGAFAFTNLNGATFDSGSHVFLSSVSTVPETEIYAMLLAGLGLLGFVTHHRKNNLLINNNIT